MSVMDWEQQFLSTRGRLGRKVFNLYVLFVFLLCVVLVVPINILGASAFDSVSFFVGLAAQGIVEAAVMPGIFLMVRRLHDLNHSGVYTVLAAIPGINVFFILYLMLFKSTKSDNRYGSEITSQKEAGSADSSYTLTEREKKYFSTEGRIGRIVLCKYIAVLLGTAAIALLILLGLSFTSVPLYGIDLMGFDVANEFGWLLEALLGTHLLSALSVAFPVYFLLVIAYDMLIIPADFLFVRRLHDIGFCGWWLLIIKVIPFAVVPFALVLMIAMGNEGSNKYGDLN